MIASSAKTGKTYVVFIVLILSIVATGAYLTLRRRHGVLSDNHFPLRVPTRRCGPQVI
jgi:LPXTG-motif cell wall-anchored protein